MPLCKRTYRYREPSLAFTRAPPGRAGHGAPSDWLQAWLAVWLAHTVPFAIIRVTDSEEEDYG